MGGGRWRRRGGWWKVGGGGGGVDLFVYGWVIKASVIIIDYNSN